MKKYIFLSLACVAIVFASCYDYNEANFKGLDELTQVQNKTAYQYSLTDADYTEIAKALRLNKNKEDSLKAADLAKYKNFSEQLSAADLIPYLLASKYYTVDPGASALVSYKFNTGVYDTTQIANTDKYSLVDADYLAMGTGKDEPGKYKNFSDKVRPEYYIPIWLNLQYPYAKAGSVKLIRYKFYTSQGVSARSSVFTLGETGWVMLPKYIIEQREGQFIFAKTETGKKWVFDPTIVISFEAADYQVLADYVKTHQAIENPALQPYPDSEFFYGCNAKYKNVTYRESDRSKDTSYPASGTTAEKVAFMDARTVEALQVYLALKFPDAPMQVSGIDQKARITLTIYSDPSRTSSQNIVWEYELQCTGEKQWKYLKRHSPTTGETETAK